MKPLPVKRFRGLSNNEATNLQQAKENFWQECEKLSGALAKQEKTSVAVSKQMYEFSS